MYEPQHFVDLHDNAGFGDPKSWLSGEDHSSSPALHRTQSSLSNATTTTGTAGNVDRVLFKDLVEIVPLVQSLIDRKANTSFTRRGSMIYTKTPSKESLFKKITEPKGKNVAQSIPTKKRRDHGDKDQGKNAGDNQDGCADGFSIFSSRALPTERDREELISLREQAVEKDSIIKSTQLQLSDAKIKLADKQAALEKLQWEAMTSNRKVEKLQDDLNSMRGEISSFMQLFEGLEKSDSTISSEDYDVTPYHLDCVPYIDDLDEMEMQKMEVAREAYIAAVAAAKERQDEDSIAAAASARLHLQSFVLRTNGIKASKGCAQCWDSKGSW
ncbi:hypothetical protein F0562_025043 [Nyssa sinensis]|uniref:Uncharacterized protein n=1 Tax=Nyssa sinensis TaxID=561372 RepID=A0A5J5BFN6_9ASTE|nr:hypothetical protein F0562_025043 [Nyssa sinensis]